MIILIPTTAVTAAVEALGVVAVILMLGLAGGRVTEEDAEKVV
jgi:hypothetical protein